MNELDLILDTIIKEKGGSKSSYKNLMDAIAYHESAGTMSSTLKQYGGGPGRGKYQFESGKNKGGITAAKRTKQYLESKNLNIPEWLENISIQDDLDVTSLNSEQQDILFLGNMRMHPKANFKNVWDGKESISEFWANYHWGGNPRDREARINSFNTSHDKYKENNIQKSDKPLPVFSKPEQIKDVTNIKKSKLNTKVLNNPTLKISDLKSFLPTQKAYGGTLNSFNNGGKHETNPHGGIPVGNNSTVEEDETSFNTSLGKYIFSHRIKI